MADNGDYKDECEDETSIVTMVDVLKAEEVLEENAHAVLGSADDKNCTYNEGYVKRQALYSCLTCLPADSKDLAGVCLACSYHCHADHDLVELYTKRNFRCDCGNSLFRTQSCKLNSGKEYSNELNRYNKNFRGLYCSCDRPYPDPENTDEDDMIQCFVCEDWFHAKHLGAPVPKEDDYAEMICGPCSDSLPFLQYYLGHAVSKVTKSSDKDGEVDVVIMNGNKESDNSQQDCVNIAETSETSTENKTEDKLCDATANHLEIEKKSPIKHETPKDLNHEPSESNTLDSYKLESIASTGTDDIVRVNKEIEPKTEENPVDEEPLSKGVVSDGEEKTVNECKLKNLKKLQRESGATFWPEGLRNLFCSCASCLEMYKSYKVSFVTDEEDTVAAYEARGKDRQAHAGAGQTQYEQGMQALSSLDRVQQMEAILSYNEMKSHLSEYLAKFVENKKVVREEDIREFFLGMQARKRRKLDIPYTCR